MRIVAPSPRWVGRVVMRRSIFLTLDVQRHSPVLRDALLGDVHVGHDLDAADDARNHPLWDLGRLDKNAVDPEPDPHLTIATLEVDVRGAVVRRLAEDGVHELDHGRVVGRLAEVRQILEAPLGFVFLDRLRDGRVKRVEPADQRLDVLGRRDGDPAHGTRDHLDVVDRDHVRRVGHREQHGVVGQEANRHGVVAAGGGRRDQVGGADVNLVGVEVEVEEAVALGDGAGELIRVDHPLLEKQRLGRAPRRPGFLDRLLRTLLVHEAELHQNVTEEHSRVTLADRRGQTRRARWLSSGGGRLNSGRGGDLLSSGGRGGGLSRGGGSGGFRDGAALAAGAGAAGLVCGGGRGPLVCGGGRAAGAALSAGVAGLSAGVALAAGAAGLSAGAALAAGAAGLAAGAGAAAAGLAAGAVRFFAGRGRPVYPRGRGPAPERPAPRARAQPQFGPRQAPAGGSWAALASGRCLRGAAHGLERRVGAGPDAQRRRALPREDLQTSDRSCACRPCGPDQSCFM